MSSNVVSIFKYMPTDMGQCPECRGYIVHPNLDSIMAEWYPDEPEYKAFAEAHADTNWHCLECDYRW